ncbi:TlpA family protein disulfide reductase [Nocardiopsis kunsanensis]|uniref:TlpA family protein disulfide reductase n=1 Tax=Nocardiopsis kunsanensis TaxID=141693 RepID=UPI000687D48F|nr:TlpA disulfide reductase family protein [Nocardiopsis kunsanensis]
MRRTRTGARPRNSVARTVAAVSVAALALSGCAGGNEVQTGGEDDRFISGDGSATAFDAGEREPAPEVEGTTFEDESLALSDYEGEILVVNVWASWCGPCRAEQPVLDEVHEEYTGLGVEFLGVNIKDDRTAAEAYTENKGVAYPSLYDQPGEVPQAFRDTVPPRAIPSTLVIDPAGDIAARVIGPTTYGQLTDLLNPVVTEFDLGDPEERPRVAEQEAEEEQEEQDSEESSGTDDGAAEGDSE